MKTQLRFSRDENKFPPLTIGLYFRIQNSWGHGHELVGGAVELWVRVLNTLKTRCVEELIHVKSVMAHAFTLTWCGVWRVICKLRYRLRHLATVQNFEVHFE
ncbi:hypothetical protein TNCV_1109081 [Trichonephila clavipes]|nr:hypothetical protein TNCV_1109081 [Trichonephila clavipes]